MPGPFKRGDLLYTTAPAFCMHHRTLMGSRHMMRLNLSEGENVRALATNTIFRLIVKPEALVFFSPLICGHVMTLKSDPAMEGSGMMQISDGPLCCANMTQKEG